MYCEQPPPDVLHVILGLEVTMGKDSAVQAGGRCKDLPKAY